MRIGVDCRLSGPQHAGIGRYIHNLTIRLPAIDPAITWVYFFNNSSQARDVSHFTNVEIKFTSVPHYSFREQLQLPFIFKAANLDLLHVPHFNIPLTYPGTLIITIHDLLWHEYRGTQVTTLPKTWYWLKYHAYKLVASKAVSKARKILVPTEVIKDTINNYYPNLGSKVVVTKEGVTSQFENSVQIPAGLEEKLPKNKKILLYVGSLYPHKNVAMVIAALHRLPDFHLVLVGARNVFQDQIRDLVKTHQVENQVSFLGYLPDDELQGLMKKSWALIQPSFSEGFGLTGIEAMAAGLPVIASNIAVFKEIYGEAGVFFNPHSETDFVKLVTSLTPTKLKKLSEVGYQQSQLYSWDRMADQTLAAYHSLLQP